MNRARQSHSLSPPRGVAGAELSNYSIGSASNPQMVPPQHLSEWGSTSHTRLGVEGAPPFFLAVAHARWCVRTQRWDWPGSLQGGPV